MATISKSDIKTQLEPFFASTLNEAVSMITAYPPMYREDVLYVFKDTIVNIKFQINEEVHMLDREIVTEILLNEETEYEGTIKKLLLLSLLDDVLEQYNPPHFKLVIYE